MAKNTLELYDYIDDHDAERATSLLLNPNDKKLAQCLNGYDRATSTKKRRRRTALLAALCLIDQEIGVNSVGHAIERLCDTSRIDELNEETIKDFIAYMKMDKNGQKIMREVVQKLTNTAVGEIQMKIARKYEVRLGFIEHKPKTEVPFRIIWD